MKPRKSRKKYNFDQLSPIEVYQLLLAGKIKKFPNGTWDQPESVEYAAEIIRYWIEHILEWSDEDIKKRLSADLFSKHNLRGLLHHVFKDSPFHAIDAAYPGRFKEWELRIAPFRFWTSENAIKAVKWLIEEKLQWSEEDIKQQFSQKTFNDNGLKGLIHEFFNDSPFKALNTAYPGKFKEWELPNVPRNYWTEENAIKAIKWLIEEKLHWSDKDIKQQFSKKTFHDNGLSNLFHKFFNGSPFKALDSAYPGRFKEWELSKVPQNFWTKETAVKAIKWLIEEKLKWPDEEIKRKMSVNVFVKYGLGRPFTKLFNYDIYEALNAAYPGRFTRQDLLWSRKSD